MAVSCFNDIILFYSFIILSNYFKLLVCFVSVCYSYKSKMNKERRVGRRSVVRNLVKLTPEDDNGTLINY